MSAPSHTPQGPLTGVTAGVAAGSTATLLPCDSLETAIHVGAVLRAARTRGELLCDAIVPAAETVLVVGGHGRTPAQLTAKLHQWIIAAPAPSAFTATGQETRIEVHYDGPDLAEVAQLTGLSPEAVVQRHQAPRYTVAFTGFAPGFGYLSGGDPALTVPRRSTPRTRVPRGAVGLAGAFSGIYPRESPGGWQLIGRTETVLFDAHRTPPALLSVGAAVRFVAVRERVMGGRLAALSKVIAEPQTTPETLPQPPRTAPGQAALGRTAQSRTSALRVEQPGLMTLVQDAGRPGLTEIGVGVAGASVPAAYRAATRLVGNRAGAAALELGLGEWVSVALAPVVLALTGAPRPGVILGAHGARPVPHHTAFRLQPGETLELGSPTQGLRSVLALRGGVAAPVTLGSRSRDTLAELGPEPLRPGDELTVGTEIGGAVQFELPDSRPLPRPGAVTPLRVVLGPRQSWCSLVSQQQWISEPWLVTPQVSRVGARLSGTPIERAPEYADRELPSEGVVRGAVQVPADGQPVIFLADHPLTGGYPVIGVVHEADLELAAQLVPGSLVRFVPATGGTLEP